MSSNASEIFYNVHISGFCEAVNVLIIHIFAHMYPLQTVTKLYSAKALQVANTPIPSIRFCIYSFGEF